jgi:radical SAM/Cys-rich protein
MPISRFGSMLVSKGQFEEYMGLLRSSFNAGNLTGLMCRNTISVDWQGYLYDCDFNQMLNIPLQHRGGGRHLTDLLQADLSGNPVVVADHCFGCTAGQGSSCGGALD